MSTGLASKSIAGGSSKAANGAAEQVRLLAALAHPRAFGADCTRVQRIDTHISSVFLTGHYAYKVKKAVDFGFLDFTTLAARRKFCEEELRLNRRLAPTLYLDVMPITGSLEAPSLGGDGPALEYAVKMREFPQDALTSRVLARGELSTADIDALAAKVAAFHVVAAVAPRDAPFGSPEEILRVVRQNFMQLEPLVGTDGERDELEALRAWTEREYTALRETFSRRRAEGFVRECHGDLHLGNIARVDDELVIFDCIEFNEAMRWIDVASEIAFTVMDLHDRGRADLAHRFLNAYLEATGDYAGLSVLRFYLVYRALVRAKIARLRAAQPGADAQASLGEYRGYVALARGYAHAQRPALVITHGLSGCGKTALSQALTEAIGAVRIRSDVERKRMHGFGALDRGGAGRELYGADATEATYDRLAALAGDTLRAGWTTIVDATFLKRAHRERFRALAAELHVPFVILAFEAAEKTLRERISRRQATGRDASDADLAVLAHQIAALEPVDPSEQVSTVVYDAEQPLEAARAPDAWKAVLERLPLSKERR